VPPFQETLRVPFAVKALNQPFEAEKAIGRMELLNFAAVVIEADLVIEAVKLSKLAYNVESFF